MRRRGGRAETVATKDVVDYVEFQTVDGIVVATAGAVAVAVDVAVAVAGDFAVAVADVDVAVAVVLRGSKDMGVVGFVRDKY